MSGFVAFDVETPNRVSNRMSAIGITVIEDSAITESFYSLVNPETHFDYFNIRLTGINENAEFNAIDVKGLYLKLVLDRPPYNKKTNSGLSHRVKCDSPE